MKVWHQRALVVSVLVGLSSANAAVAQFGWHYNHNQAVPDLKGDYTSSEKSLKAALEATEKSDPDGRKVISALQLLAWAYKCNGRYAEAEPLMKRALAIKGKTKGPNQLTLANMSNDLAVLYCLEGKYSEAETLFKDTLPVQEKLCGPNSVFVASSLNNLAELYCSEGKYAEAESSYKRSLAIWERWLGPDIFRGGFIVTKLNNLAIFYYDRGKYVQAEPLFKRALAILDHTLDPHYKNEAAVRSNYAHLLRKTGRKAEAAVMEVQAEAAVAPETPQKSLEVTGTHVRLDYQPLLPENPE